MKEPWFYKFARPIIWFLMKLIFHPKYIGLENIPDDGRIILAGNHTNDIDCWLVISSTKRIVHFLAKDELVKGKLGFIFKGMGIIPVDRTIHDHNALNSGINALNENKCIGIFPEGTINRGSGITLPFKIGAVKMAKETNSYIVPFVITGKYKPFINDLTIEFLTPYMVSGNEDLTNDNDILMEKIQDRIKEKRM